MCTLGIVRNMFLCSSDSFSKATDYSWNFSIRFWPLLFPFMTFDNERKLSMQKLPDDTEV